jgi:UDP-N-acetylmuramoylalanine--D-glutamate ligase
VIGQIAGRRTWVGGNIGRPLIADLHKMAADDLVIQELSSFQLEIWDQSPPIAAVLNITPNHLDRHKTMQAYTRAKANILRHQNKTDITVLSADDPGALALRGIAHGRVRLFSCKRAVPDGAFVRAGQIWLRNAAGMETAVCPLADVQLRGRHNLANVLAAVTLADSAGIHPAAMAEAIRTFTGVEHRLEWVRTVLGVHFINDSIATAPERALAALHAYREPVILLAGGRDKAMQWDDWAAQVRQRVKRVILFGELAPLLAEKLGDFPAATMVDSMTAAVAAAQETAVAGDVVLLSPGGTSFDAFVDFAARGEQFKDLVNQL